MSPRLALAIGLAALACLSTAPTALAVGLGAQRVAAGPKAVSHPSRVTTAETLIAPRSVCPNQNDLSASAAAQEQAMACMTDFARRGAGLGDLAPDAALTGSAAAKSGDILRCDSFSHFACDREFSYWIRAAGYMSTPCWRVGENLAWGTGEYGSVRSIFEAWMRSPEHRANILGDFAAIGIDVRVGELSGQPGTRVWTQHFGSHCG